MEGFTPPHRFKARTAASDGRLAYPRACASALAVIALSKAIDVGRDHLIHRKRSPFPYEGKALTTHKLGETANVRRNTSGNPANSVRNTSKNC